MATEASLADYSQDALRTGRRPHGRCRTDASHGRQTDQRKSPRQIARRGCAVPRCISARGGRGRQASAWIARIAQVVQIVMEGYADRPALGQRARELVTNSANGRKTLRLLPRSENHHIPRAVGGGGARLPASGTMTANIRSRRAISVPYPGFRQPGLRHALNEASIHLGATIVPLRRRALPATQHTNIIAETEPRILAAGRRLPADAAVDAILAGTVPHRLVVFDYDARDDDHRDKLESARRRLTAANSPDCCRHARRRGEPSKVAAGAALICAQRR